jgi:hypothetical protein
MGAKNAFEAWKRLCENIVPGRYKGKGEYAVKPMGLGVSYFMA